LSNFQVNILLVNIPFFQNQKERETEEAGPFGSKTKKKEQKFFFSETRNS